MSSLRKMGSEKCFEQQDPFTVFIKIQTFLSKISNTKNPERPEQAFCLVWKDLRSSRVQPSSVITVSKKKRKKKMYWVGTCYITLITQTYLGIDEYSIFICLWVECELEAVAPWEVAPVFSSSLVLNTLNSVHSIWLINISTHLVAISHLLTPYQFFC